MNEENKLELYTEVARLHETYMPHIRIGQFWSNVRDWLRIEHGQDIFYLDDHFIITRIKEFVGEEN